MVKLGRQVKGAFICGLEQLMVSSLVLDPVYPPLLDLLSIFSVYRHQAEE